MVYEETGSCYENQSHGKTYPPLICLDVVEINHDNIKESLDGVNIFIYSICKSNKPKLEIEESLRYSYKDRMTTVWVEIQEQQSEYVPLDTTNGARLLNKRMPVKVWEDGQK
jgi:hypothetical protein